MLWAASTTTFCGFCRSGEVTVQCESKFGPQMYLCFSDIAVDNALSPNTISIKLKLSKTDQLKKGVKLVMGRTNDDLCPVTALLPYVIHHGDAPGPLFQLDNHTPLSKSKFVNHVHPALLAANVPAHLYTGHSFCIKAATTQQQLLLQCGSCVRCKDVQVRWLLAVQDGRDSQILTLIVV